MSQLPTTVLMPTAASSAAQVIVRDQQGAQYVVPLGTNGLSVGRDGGCDVFLDSDNVSRRHVQISWDGTQAYVTDLGSTNGSRLSGRQLQSGVNQSWPAGALLQVGDCTLRLEIPGAAPAATTRVLPAAPLALAAQPSPVPVQALAAEVIPAPQPVPQPQIVYAPMPPAATGWGGCAMSFLVVMTFLFPIVGIVGGIVGLTKSETRGQGGALLAIAAVAMIINFILYLSIVGY